MITFYFHDGPPTTAARLSVARHFRFVLKSCRVYSLVQTPSSISRERGSRFTITHCRPTAQLPEKPKRPPQGSPSTRAHTLQHLRTQKTHDIRRLVRKRALVSDVHTRGINIATCTPTCSSICAQVKSRGRRAGADKATRVRKL